MSRGARPLAVVVLVAVAGGATWWALRPGEPAGNGPTPVDTGEGPPTPRTPSPPREVAVAAAPPPREAIASADDARIPVPTDWPGGLRIQFPDVPPSLEVTGEKVRDALMATPGLHLRWSSEAVRDAFLKAKVKLPAQLIAAPPDAPPEARGAPMPMIVGSIEQAGFSARLDPPVLRISEKKDPPSDQTPR